MSQLNCDQLGEKITYKCTHAAQTCIQEQTVFELAEEKIPELKDRSEETIQTKEQKLKKKKKNERSLRGRWDVFKSTDIHIIGVTEEDRERKKYF